MISALKIQVEETYGMPIKYGNQCKDLSESISNQTDEYISFQTLRRFFNFIDQNQAPSNRTLDILSRFCGFQHYDDFCANLGKKKSNTNFLESIFNISLRKELDLNYHLVCRNVAQIIYNDLSILNKHMRFLTQSPIAYEYFFERFPFIDHLHNPIYRRSLLAYLKNKQTLEAKVFVESVFFLADYLKGKQVERKNITFTLSNIPQVHPFLQARIIGTHLLLSKKPAPHLIKLAMDTARKKPKKDNTEIQFPFFNYMMADYFIICRLYNEAITMIEAAKVNEQSTPSGWLETGYYETLDLLYAIALEGANKKQKAAKVFEQINTEHFHFIFHKYFTIQYLILKKKLDGALSKNQEEALQKLYSETKFHKL